MKVKILCALMTTAFILAFAGCAADHGSGSAGGHISGGGSASGSVSGHR